MRRIILILSVFLAYILGSFAQEQAPAILSKVGQELPPVPEKKEYCTVKFSLLGSGVKNRKFLHIRSNPKLNSNDEIRVQKGEQMAIWVSPDFRSILHSAKLKVKGKPVKEFNVSFSGMDLLNQTITINEDCELEVVVYSKPCAYYEHNLPFDERMDLIHWLSFELLKPNRTTFVHPLDPTNCIYLKPNTEYKIKTHRGGYYLKSLLNNGVEIKDNPVIKVGDASKEQVFNLKALWLPIYHLSYDDRLAVSLIEGAYDDKRVVEGTKVKVRIKSRFGSYKQRFLKQVYINGEPMEQEGFLAKEGVYEFVMKKDTYIRADFEEEQVQELKLLYEENRGNVSIVNASDEGISQIKPNSYGILTGTTVQLKIEPKKGYKVWAVYYGEQKLDDNTCLITEGNKPIKVYFKPLNYVKVTKNKKYGIDISGLYDEGGACIGDKIRIKVHSSRRYIKSLKINGQEFSPYENLNKKYETEYIVTGATHIELEGIYMNGLSVDYDSKRADIIFSENVKSRLDENGVLRYLFPEGDEIEVEVKPKEGYKLIHFGKDSYYKYPLAQAKQRFEYDDPTTKHLSLIVEIAPINPLKIKERKIGRGHIYVENYSDYGYKKGEQLTLLIQTADNYDNYYSFIKQMTINGKAMNEEHKLIKDFEHTFTIERDMDILAEFYFPPSIRLKDFDKSMGTVELSNTKFLKKCCYREERYFFRPKDRVRVIAKPKDGHRLKAILYKGKDIKYRPYISVRDDYDTSKEGRAIDLEVLFEKVIVRKKITIPVVEGGLLAIKGVKSGEEVELGKELELVVTPLEGYELESLTIGGKDVTKELKFTVGEDNTIIAKFRSLSAVQSLDGLSPKVYPNPASHFVKLSGFEPNAELCVLDLNGHILLRLKFDAKGSSLLDVSSLDRGNYLIKSSKYSSLLQLR